MHSVSQIQKRRPCCLFSLIVICRGGNFESFTYSWGQFRLCFIYFGSRMGKIKKISLVTKEMGQIGAKLFEVYF